MKKMYCCFICFFLSIFSFNFCYCQVSFGVKSGINIATVKDLNIDPKNRIGWYVGASVFIPLNKKIFFQPELLFSSKGYRYRGNLVETKKSTARLDYLTMPIMFGYKIDHKTSFFLGSEIGYLLSVYEETPYATFNVSHNFPVKIDVELNLGLRYKISENFGLDVRYSHGFKNMYMTDAVGLRMNKLSAGNRVFQIGGFYSFSVK